MSDEIEVFTPKSMTELTELSKMLAASALMPSALRKRPEDVAVIVLTGMELGLGPMQAARGINVINGKGSLSASLMVALVKKSPVCKYFQMIESTHLVATYETWRVGNPAPTRMSFTIEQARVAGMMSNPNMQKYPEAQLRARCQSNLANAEYQDVCFGLYDSDSNELGAEEFPPDEPKPMAVHVEEVKAALKAQASRVVAEPVIEAEFVPPPPEAPAPEAPKATGMSGMLDRIAAAATPEELKALIPEMTAAAGPLSADGKAALKAAFFARRAALSPAAPTAT